MGSRIQARGRWTTSGKEQERNDQSEINWLRGQSSVCTRSQSAANPLVNRAMFDYSVIRRWDNKSLGCWGGEGGAKDNLHVFHGDYLLARLVDCIVVGLIKFVDKLRTRFFIDWARGVWLPKLNLVVLGLSRRFHKYPHTSKVFDINLLPRTSRIFRLKLQHWNITQAKQIINLLLLGNFCPVT